MSQNSGEVAAPISARRIRPLMGTFCVIEATHRLDSLNDDSLNDVINRAYAAMRQVNDLMHPVNGVDLSRINQVASRVIRIDELTWQVLRLAKQINEHSNGVFDPCLPARAGCMRDVELLPDNQVICHAPVVMDLGGIAKGLAVDCAVNVLIKAGCSNGLVNAGGDVRVFGEMQQMYIKMSVGLTNSTAVHPEPVEGRMQTESGVLQVALCDQALAVSQLNHADRPVEHQGYYQRCTETLVLHEHVAVIAQSAAIADALTKCGMFIDQLQFAQLCSISNAQSL